MRPYVLLDGTFGEQLVSGFGLRELHERTTSVEPDIDVRHGATGTNAGRMSGAAGTEQTLTFLDPPPPVRYNFLFACPAMLGMLVYDMHR